MLQSQTVDATTLELLKNLMKLPELDQFHLVGGTNLSLRFGHRLSIDIDLFTTERFEPLILFQEIKSAFPQAELKSSTRSMLFFYINSVKIDCVLAPFPYLQPIEIIEDIRFVSTPDVIAMKLGAMSSRGVKKDFWDIAELLDHYKLEEMLAFFATKYNANDPFFVVRSLTYFEDAELQIDPQPLKKITWEQVKKKVEKAVRDFLK
jgi:predicted nucleotidyltransferase component of viral defense system